MNRTHRNACKLLIFHCKTNQDPSYAECANMTIDATNAGYFELITTNNTNIRGTEILCPQNNSHSEEEEDAELDAACFIDTSGQFVMANSMTIWAARGMPRDITIDGDFNVALRFVM